jgi:hypothetical protein
MGIQESGKKYTSMEIYRNINVYLHSQNAGIIHQYESYKTEY